MEQIIAQVIGGAVGGFGGSKAVKGGDMGQLGNLLSGAIGGVAGGQLLGGLLDGAGGGGGIGAIAADLVGGGVAGAIVQVIVGQIVARMKG